MDRDKMMTIAQAWIEFDEWPGQTTRDMLTAFALEQIAKREKEIAARLENECSRFIGVGSGDCPMCQIAAELREGDHPAFAALQGEGDKR